MKNGFNIYVVPNGDEDMLERFYRTRNEDVTMVSVDVVNQVSEYLIAQVDNSAELDDLVLVQEKEQYARKEAWKLAYKDVPLPPQCMSLEDRRILQERRNDLAEIYYIDIINR